MKFIFQGLIYEIKKLNFLYFMDRPGEVNEKNYGNQIFHITENYFIFYEPN